MPTLGHISAGVAWSCMPALASTSFWAMPCIFLLAACSQATIHTQVYSSSSMLSLNIQLLLSPAWLHRAAILTAAASLGC